MAIESKNLLVAVKAYSRGNALPLDASEVYESLLSAQTYATEANAYAGQTIKVLLEDGKYHSYVLQPSDSGLTLEEVGAIKEDDLKKYVQIVTELPTTGEENIIYIVGTTGSIWTGTKYETVFKDLTSDLQDINNSLDTKAPIENPTFIGTVKVGEDEVAVKSFVEGLIANLHSGVPEILNSTSPLPTTNYKAGQMWRVSEAGTYAGQRCEIGDLIICLTDYNKDTKSDNDFMIVQANIDGAVTSSVETVTDASVVVFDGVTGKVIKSSNISLTDLTDAVNKKHEHTNKTQLDTYTKTETELLTDAQSTANGLVEAAKTELTEKIDKKANSADVYTTNDIDGKLETITNNLNSKLDASAVENKIKEATGLESGTVKDYVDDAVNTNLGDLGENETVKDYVDNALLAKADKATTLAGYGIVDSYTNTEVDNKVSSDIAAAKSEIRTELNAKIDEKAAQTDLDDVASKVTTLIGTDDNKSVRTIANEELVAKLIAADAKESLDTLEEIAAWIQSHPEDASKMNAEITALKNQLIGIDAGEGTVKKYIDDNIAAIDLSPYATTTALTSGITEAKTYADTAINNALTIVRF